MTADVLHRAVIAVAILMVAVALHVLIAAEGLL